MSFKAKLRNWYLERYCPEVLWYVATGAELLDAQRPQWHNKIRLQDLKVSYAFSCVMHQVYGDFQMGMSEAGLLCVHARDYGFLCDPKENRIYRWAWANEVEKRS
jgi:hypothetical protein